MHFAYPASLQVPPDLVIDWNNLGIGGQKNTIDFSQFQNLCRFSAWFSLEEFRIFYFFLPFFTGA